MPNNNWIKLKYPTLKEDYYYINDTGDIKIINAKIRHGKGYRYVNDRPVKRWQKHKNDYYHVSLGSAASGTRKNYPIHRLVAYNFCDGYKEGLTVNHIDENKHNNHYSNLEWVTMRENIFKSHKKKSEHEVTLHKNARLNEYQVLTIHTLMPFYNYTAIAEKMGLTRHMVRSVAIGVNYKKIVRHLKKPEIKQIMEEDNE